MNTKRDNESDKSPFVVAVDGPAGSGKSTVARLLADHIDLGYLDTGAMYRAVTYACLRRQVNPWSAQAVTEVAQNCTIVQEQDGKVFVDCVDATIEIRSQLVSSVVSMISSHESVRQELVSQQRQWVRSQGGGVLDGRDIATAVFPDALLKIYLTADPKIRATRRALEVVSPEDNRIAFNTERDRLLSDMRKRDKLDSEREHDPLRQADDAITVDTSNLTIDEVVDDIVELWHHAKGSRA